MHLITIIKPYLSYAPGTVVDFPDETAKAMVKAGIARDYSHPQAQQAIHDRPSFTKKMVKKEG